MAKEVSLSVNNSPIELEYFVREFIEHVVGGVLSALRGTGPIENLELAIDSAKQVTINLNNAQVPLSPFASEIVGSTIKGMVSTLRGVNNISTLHITIKS